MHDHGILSLSYAMYSFQTIIASSKRTIQEIEFDFKTFAWISSSIGEGNPSMVPLK
jgi:hypothetical protein